LDITAGKAIRFEGDPLEPGSIIATYAYSKLGVVEATARSENGTE
jgi:hypothetical protein